MQIYVFARFKENCKKLGIKKRNESAFIADLLLNQKWLEIGKEGALRISVSTQFS